MSNIYLIRHGEAAATVAEDPDPGLSPLGWEQARAAATQMRRFAPMRLYSSPLKRAQETAVPLAQAWEATVTIEPAVAEIPYPTTDLAARAAWLRQIMPGAWTDLDDTLLHWRSDLVATLTAQTDDVVLFSHFVAINLAVGAATADERMVVFRPDNASITQLQNDDGELRVVSLGGEAITKVN